VTYDDEILLTFNELLDEMNVPEPANFQYFVEGESRDITSFTVSGKTVTLQLPGSITVGQEVSVNYYDSTASVNDVNAIQDRLGNDADSFDSPVDNGSNTADETAPIFQHPVLRSDGRTIVLVYNEILNSEEQPTDDAFSVEVGGSTGTVSDVNVQNRTRNVEVVLQDLVAGNQTVTVAYDDPTTDNDPNAIQNLVGNDAASLTARTVHGESTAPDGDPPMLVSATVPATGDRIVWTFDEILDEARGPRARDFLHTVHGESRDVSDVTVSGQTVTLTLPTVITSDEIVSVTYTDPRAGFNDPNAIQDVSGSDAASFTKLLEDTDQGSTVADEAGPELDSAATTDDGKRIILTFDEVLLSDDGSIPTGTEFTINVDGQAVQLESDTPVLVRGRAVELALATAVTEGQSVSVTYSAPTSDNAATNAAIQDPAGNDAAGFEDEDVRNNVARPPSRPSTPSGSPSSGSSTPGSTPGTEARQGPLVLVLTVPEAPVEVGQTLTYTVTIVNSGSESLTALTWREVTAETAAQALSDLAAGDSVSVTGTVRPMQDDHIPHIILTVAADSDQTDEIVTSTVVQVVAATTPSTEGEQSGQVPTGVRPKVPSSLVLRVIRVDFKVADAHLAHNIPDLTLTLADGSEASCGFLSYYEATAGVARWGHAISEVLQERPGSLTQYFQRGVLDCAARDGEWRVGRRPAWDYLGGGVDGAPDLGVEPGLISEQPGELLGPWGHRVSNLDVHGTYIGFLDFFTALGGEATFGLPKTEARYDDDPRAVLRVPNSDAGVIRQYFQAAVLEYHPDDVIQPVKLYFLGDALRDWRYPAYGAFASFGSFGPLSDGQPYHPPATSNVLRPAG
jgi:uncharacterized repeat protein (TIGR02059 family)